MSYPVTGGIPSTYKIRVNGFNAARASYTVTPYCYWYSAGWTYMGNIAGTPFTYDHQVGTIAIALSSYTNGASN